MATKPYYNVELSLQQAPPQKFTKGGKHIKRIVLHRSVIRFLLEENSRELTVEQAGVAQIRDSLMINGWVHDARPPIVYEDPEHKGHYIGISGFHRNAAMEQLEWETMMVDIYEFPSPLAIRVAKGESNHHTKPFTPLTKRDILKQVLEAIRNNEIPNDEKEIKELVDIIGAVKTPQERKNIFRDVIKRRGGTSTLRTYCSSSGESSTEEIAIQLKLPFSGAEHYSLCGEYGYINSSPTPKTTLYDAKKLSMNNGGAKVAIIGFIEKPREVPKLYTQRNNHTKTFGDFLKTDAEYMQFIMSKLGYNVELDDILKEYTVYYKGYLPQDKTPDVTKGGNPKEETLVDEVGNPI
jgi:hypothetical protein